MAIYVDRPGDVLDRDRVAVDAAALSERSPGRALLPLGDHDACDPRRLAEYALRSLADDLSADVTHHQSDRAADCGCRSRLAAEAAGPVGDAESVTRGPVHEYARHHAAGRRIECEEIVVGLVHRLECCT